MKKSFYDIKKRARVELEVTGKKDMSTPMQKRYAFKAKTEDGRPLTTFVSKEEYDGATDIKEV